MRLMAALMLSSMFLADTALAADAFVPPAGCTPLLTVQTKSCEVVNHWQCEAGTVFYYGYFREDGEMGNQTIKSADGHFLGANDFDNDIRMVGNVPPVQRYSLDELMDLGTTAQELTISATMAGQFQESPAVQIDTLDGTRVTIDGEEFLGVTGQSDVHYPDGSLMFSTQEERLLLPGDRVILTSRKTERTAEGVTVLDTTPVEVIRPGEDGFFSRIPKHDCGEQTSSLDLNIQRGNGRAPEGGERS